MADPGSSWLPPSPSHPPSSPPWLPLAAAAAVAAVAAAAVVWIGCWPQRLCFVLKMIAFYAWIIALSALAAAVCAARGRDVRNFRTVKALVRHLQTLYGVSVRVENAHRLLTTTSPYVIVCNHQSSIDFIALMECLPERCAPIAKRELLYVGPFGAIAWLCGVIFIDRQRTHDAKITMSGVASVMRESGTNVWIFPEGTRSHGAPMLPFKKGAFHLAVQAQAPILPIVFSSYHSFYSRAERRFTPGCVVATVLPPVSTVGLGPDTVPRLTESVRESMITAFLSSSTSSTSSSSSSSTTTTTTTTFSSPTKSEEVEEVEKKRR